MSKRSGEPAGKPAELTPKSSLPEPPGEPATPGEQDVADLAYRRWLERGCPQGSPEEDWFEAEHELQARNRSA